MTIRITLALLVVASTAAAQPKPTDAECRAYLDDGHRLSQAKSYEEARARFHAARTRCANPLAFVLIARSYEEQGDLPRALAYLEHFLTVVGADHELRAPMENAAADLRARVPAEQRVRIDGELATTTSAPPVAPPQPRPQPQPQPQPQQDPPDARRRLNNQVEHFDMKVDDRTVVRSRRAERARGFFVGANVAYATMAKVEISTERMSGTLDFPSAYAAELQLGYRVMPTLSVALVPQMFFNLAPKGQDAARAGAVFVQATGHVVVAPRWDLDVLAAPGYSVLFVPDADDARGLAFRYGGGPRFHLNEHVSVGGELVHQIGFEKRDRGDVDMRTSFLSVLLGARFRY